MSLIIETKSRKENAPIIPFPKYPLLPFWEYVLPPAPFDRYLHTFYLNRITLYKLLCNCYFSNVLFSYAIIRNDLLIVSSRNQLQNSSSKKKKVKHQMENWKIFRAGEPVWETLGLASSSFHSLSLPSWFLSTILSEHLLHPSLRIKKFLCIYIYLRPKVEYFYFLDSFFFQALPFSPIQKNHFLNCFK